MVAIRSSIARACDAGAYHDIGQAKGPGNSGHRRMRRGVPGESLLLPGADTTADPASDQKLPVDAIGGPPCIVAW